MKKIFFLIFIILFSGCVETIGTNTTLEEKVVKGKILSKKPKVLINKNIKSIEFRQLLATLVNQINQKDIKISNVKETLTYKIENYTYNIKYIGQKIYKHTLYLKMFIIYGNKEIIQEINVEREIELNNKQDLELIAYIVDKALSKGIKQMKNKLRVNK